ncbi:helix-turn-helix transcriptional regulator [Burkholderia stabilis]|uniref:helix-turn-helix transcriptional regulator n=1 Tax=Burkholderia stabilis TaxID=95485 RepID=UPI0009F5D343|nr:AlpA family phage regulatory protein [Burkholderia stabilis]HDR9493137.1 AlpA family phage regulatory protein [Burkholderia stabilis]HDR9525210.1 AlpA family phage regulatory protein [Burkholderia stabilis]HDR9532525.1 AlpA family phage regulatory protein [Burkholderia stabilis]HDR9540435.1 AlpA family phage regulatory protein [Burkholderia stabilis]HDR9547781.1 AlpA family phage regulatory protein [Burkholderia stabilis]
MEVQKNDPPVTTNRVVRLRPLTERIGLSKSEIYRQIQAGTFPRSISLGVRAVGWLECDIEAWLAARVKQSEAQ